MARAAGRRGRPLTRRCVRLRSLPPPYWPPGRRIQTSSCCVRGRLVRRASVWCAAEPTTAHAPGGVWSTARAYRERAVGGACHRDRAQNVDGKMAPQRLVLARRWRARDRGSQAWRAWCCWSLTQWGARWQGPAARCGGHSHLECLRRAGAICGGAYRSGARGLLRPSPPLPAAHPAAAAGRRLCLARGGSACRHEGGAARSRSRAGCVELRQSLRGAGAVCGGTRRVREDCYGRYAAARAATHEAAAWGAAPAGGTAAAGAGAAAVHHLHLTPSGSESSCSLRRRKSVHELMRVTVPYFLRKCIFDFVFPVYSTYFFL